MDSRRDFLKKAAILSTGAGLMTHLPPSIQKALSIDPALGSTFWDAEHVVILMQENRSFDHCFGALPGVRGFNDPRAIRQPNGNKVWLQTDAQGNTYAPFRLDMKGSNATWIYSLPHAWEDQSGARNHGWHDRWLHWKQTGLDGYKNIPLTLGYYNREDLPFYYALADAFTVCDQHFCSSLTGTTPNRLYLWSGTIREKPDFQVKANVKNEDVDYEKWVRWTSFPERLEEHGIPWRIYQNEISVPSGLEGEYDALLANFTDNPIEWFEQYRVKFHPEYRQHLLEIRDKIPAEIRELEAQVATLTGAELENAQRTLARKKDFYQLLLRDLDLYVPEKFEQLSDFHKNIHQKAFTTNRNDPDYRSLAAFEYEENGEQRSLNLPKGDLLHQFRKDVQTGNLPTVSWLVAPEKFSDHPDAPWYGAWYVSEALDILTQNPEVWKKTIFILTYDENDGLFDHVPPFVAPHHERPETGKASEGIDLSVEQVNILHEQKRNYKNPEKQAVQGPIGLGFRVPMVIASPWSRGGQVCSEVFDHTSVLQFLETFLSKKTKKAVQESNISEWRRTVCGDLTSVFQPYNGEKIIFPEFINKGPFIKGIHQAKFQDKPSGFKAFNAADIERINHNDKGFDWGARQEKGMRKSRPLPYELYVEGIAHKKNIVLQFKAGKDAFAEKACGSPFIAYTSRPYRQQWAAPRHYAVRAGDTLSDTWDMAAFEDGRYHLEVYGPNGFYRALKGNADTQGLETTLDYEIVNGVPTGHIVLTLHNHTARKRTFHIRDLAYDLPSKNLIIDKKSSQTLFINLGASHFWYELSVQVEGLQGFERRYAGRVETGEEGMSDPAMSW